MRKDMIESIRAAARRGGLWREGVSLDELAEAEAGRLLYVASPYALWAKRREGSLAAEGAALWVGLLAGKGCTGVSPILHGHTACAAVGRHSPATRLDALDAVFWGAWCGPLLRACAAAVVPPIEGWADSVGVAAECRAMMEAGKPVYILSPLKGS